VLRLWAVCGIGAFGKGGEGKGTEITPAKVDLNPAVGSSHQKESNHGHEAKEKEEDEEDLMRAPTSYRGCAVIFGIREAP